MNSTGRNKKSGYLVTLLLVVGLAAFSNSMRELAEIQLFAGIPQNPPQVVVAKLDSCESRQAVQSVEAQWLEDVEGITEPGVQLTVPAPPVKVERVAPRVRVKPTETQLAKVDKFKQFEFHPTPFEFKISTDDFDDSGAMSKAKNRKHNNVFRLNTRDRELILRTLNRSINLRTAS